MLPKTKSTYITLILSLVVVELLLLIPLNSGYTVWHSLEPSAHIVIFSLLTLLLLESRKLREISIRRMSGRSSLLTLIICCAIALQTELMQLATSRNFDVSDLVLDIVSSLITLLAYLGLQRFSRRKVFRIENIRIKPLCLAALLPAFIWASIDPAYFIARSMQRWRAFPLISSFQYEWDKEFILKRNVLMNYIAFESIQADGYQDSAAEVTFLPSKYPGFTIVGPFPDWSVYSTFAVTCVSHMDSAMLLNLRINDSEHSGQYSDRFNRIISIAQGENAIRIPLIEILKAPNGRRMSLSNIDNVTFFMSNLKSPVTIGFKDVRLEEPIDLD